MNEKEYAACIKNSDENKWKCKCGFKNVEEGEFFLTNKKQEWIQCNVLIQYSKTMPNYFRSLYIKSMLTHQVKITHS